MPTYQYKCNNCDFELEEVFRMDDRNDPVDHPEKYGTCSDENSDSCDLHLVPQLMAVQYTMRDGIQRHTSDGFKDRMKEIHRTTPGSQLGDYT
jgi:putative FmdB family regulatory protein|tara:strand:- start:1434 stop:1712 length:279 start_codon:yes stop_codon:yes gene_type:complete